MVRKVDRQDVALAAAMAVLAAEDARERELLAELVAQNERVLAEAAKLAEEQG